MAVIVNARYFISEIKAKVINLQNAQNDRDESNDWVRIFDIPTVHSKNARGTCDEKEDT